MRYHGNKICPDERPNDRCGRTARKHNAFVDTVWWRRQKTAVYFNGDRSKTANSIRGLSGFSYGYMYVLMFALWRRLLRKTGVRDPHRVEDCSTWLHARIVYTFLGCLSASNCGLPAVARSKGDRTASQELLLCPLYTEQRMSRVVNACDRWSRTCLQYC